MVDNTACWYNIIVRWVEILFAYNPQLLISDGSIRFDSFIDVFDSIPDGFIVDRFDVNEAGLYGSEQKDNQDPLINMQMPLNPEQNVDDLIIDTIKFSHGSWTGDITHMIGLDGSTCYQLLMDHHRNCIRPWQYITHNFN